MNEVHVHRISNSSHYLQLAVQSIKLIKFGRQTISRLPDASFVSSELNAQQVTGPLCPDNVV